MIEAAHQRPPVSTLDVTVMIFNVRIHMVGRMEASSSASLPCYIATIPALLVAVGSSELSLQKYGPAIDFVKGLGDDGRAVGSDGGANGHEEAVTVNPRHDTVTDSMPTQMWRQTPSYTAPTCVAFHWAPGRSARCW